MSGSSVRFKGGNGTFRVSIHFSSRCLQHVSDFSPQWKNRCKIFKKLLYTGVILCTGGFLWLLSRAVSQVNLVVFPFRSCAEFRLANRSCDWTLFLSVSLSPLLHSLHLTLPLFSFQYFSFYCFRPTTNITNFFQPAADDITSTILGTKVLLNSKCPITITFLI
jgi:hypothetical protein